MLARPRRPFAPVALAMILTLPLLGTTAHATLSISEFVANNDTGLQDEDGDESDWIEIYNDGPSDVGLAGYFLTDDATDLNKWAFPAISLASGGHLVVFASNKDRRDPASELHTNFRLSAGGEYLALVAPDGSTIVHEFAPSFPAQFPDVSYGFGTSSTATNLIAQGAPARAFVPTDDSLGVAWIEPGFNDAAWPAGSTGAGFETESGYEGEIGLDLTAAMSGANSTAYVRIPFTVSDASTVDALSLRMKYDDGFVAYLNGDEIVRRNAPGSATTGDGLTSFTHTSNGEGDAIELTGVSLNRGGLPVDYDVSELIGITLTQFRAGSNANNITTPAGTSAPTTNQRAALLDSDTDLNTGIINPGGQSSPLTSDPTATTPGMAIQFDTPVVNGPGPDVVFFELQTTINPTTGDPFHVSPLSGIGTNGLQSITISNFDIQFDNGPALSGFQLWNCDSAPQNLGDLETVGLSQNGGDNLDFRVIGTGIDLSDLGYPESAQVDGLFFQANATNGGVDPVFIAGLPTTTPAGLTWSASATSDRPDQEALQYETIRLAPFIDSLVTGSNVLAIHGLNSTAGDPDFLLVPELEAADLHLDPSKLRYFSTPTPGDENGTGLNDLGPSLTQHHHIPEPPGETDDVVVTVRVAETLNPVATVSLHYRVAYEPEVTVSMIDGGGGHYSAHIPAAAADAGEMLRWRISAVDTGGNTSRLPAFLKPTGSAEYFGTVVTDPNLTTQMPVLHRIVQDPASANTRSGSRASVYWAGEFYDNVFIRLRGRVSQSWPKKSYKIDFNDGEHFRFRPEFPRTDEINLNSTYSDVSYLRTVLSFETWRDCGTPSPDVQLVRVHQNGAFFNLSLMIEQVQRDFLRRNELSDEGALYKMDTNSLETPRYSSTSGVEKRTRKDEDNSDLAALMAGLTLTGSALDTFIFDNINLPPELCYLGGFALNQHVSGTVRNYYMYRDTTGSREWQSLPWDPDISWGYFFGSGTTIYTSNDSPNPISHPFMGDFNYSICYGTLLPNIVNPFRGVIFQNPRTRQMYLRRLRTLMDTYLQEEALVPEAQRHFESRIDALVMQIAPDVVVDQSTWGGSNNSGAEVPLQTATDRLKNDYLTPRRHHLFSTHSVNNPAYPDGVGIPDSQPVHPPIQIGAIDINPVSANQDQEFIEIVNPNSYAVDLSGWRVEGAVEHTFRPGTVLPANDPSDPKANKLYLTPDAAAFRNRTTGPSGGQGLFVQGGYRGHLSNFSETIELREPDDTLAASLTYPGNPSDAQLYLVISEIMYHPAGDPNAEFIELLNTSDTVTLNLTGVRFTGGIQYSIPAGTMLAPGQRLVIWFAQFENDSRLNNDGETIKLEDATNSSIAEFRYNDASPWPEEADGSGQSLVFIAGDPDDPLNWRASTAPNPGSSDTDHYQIAEDPLSYAIAALPEIDNDELSFTLNPAADDARVEIEFSTDLLSWQTAELSLLSRTGQTFVYDLRPLGSPRMFYRLAVSVSEP